MLLLLLLIASVFGGYLYLASPNRVAKLAGDLLAGISGTNVQIDSARFGWDGIITLHGVEMRISGVEGDGSLLFDAERVQIKHDLLSLLSGKFRAKIITFIKPVLHLTELIDTGKFNYQYLRQQRDNQPTNNNVLDELPEIFLRDGETQFGEVVDDKFSILGAIRLSGNLVSSVDESGVYFFTLRPELEGDQPDSASPILVGKIDLKDVVVSAKLEEFTFDSPQRVMLPQQLREWWDQLEPVGSLSSVTFGYNPDPAIGFNAELEMHGVSMTLPYGELDSRMTDVSGRFSIVNDQITITELTGQIENIEYVINGQVTGFSRDAPFRLSLETDDFAIPEQPRYLLALPTPVQKQFRRLSPSGTFKALVVIERKQLGGRLGYDGTVRVSNARMKYHQFPYPLEGVNGELRFDDERIELVGLRGRGPTDASVVVNGSISPPQDGAAVHVVVTAVDSPIDHVLYDAVPKRVRPILDLFFNKEAYQRLIDSGVIQTSEQHKTHLKELEHLRLQSHATRTQQNDQLEVIDSLNDKIKKLQSLINVPVFNLGGRATVVSQSSRAYGPGQKIRTTVSLKIAGVDAIFAYWPYPVRGRGGHLLIKPDEVIVDGIELEGLSGASGVINGIINIPKPGEGDLTPDLSLTISDMPIDGLLISSIPVEQQAWMKSLHLKGLLTGEGRIFSKEGTDKIDYQIQTNLTDGSVQPNGGRVKIDQLTGHGILARDEIKIDSLEGQHGESHWRFSSEAQWDREHPRLKFDLEVVGLDLHESVSDLLPPDESVKDRVQTLFKDLQPEGVCDIDLNYRLTHGQSPDYRMTMRFDRLGFMWGKQKIDLVSINGGFVVTPKGVELDTWGGSFQSGQFSTSGTVGFGEENVYDLTFDAASEKICPVTRTVLPDVVLSVIDGLEVDGSYEMSNAHLGYSYHEGKPVFDFHGKANIRNGIASIGVPITDMSGELLIDAKQTASDEWPHLELRLDADQLLAAERFTSPLTLHIVTSDQPDWLSIRGLHGACYGGTLLGSGEIQLSGEGMYRMNLVLQDVALNPFINKENPLHADLPAARTSEDQYTGVLAASLTIEGSSGKPNVRRGRGELEIREANLYEVPLSLALIQILNLSLPASSSFDRASASYLIDNDLVWFDSVRFEAPTVEIVGGGFMQYSSLELDLNLYTRNPKGPKLGALSDLFRVFKDELLSIHVTGTLEEPIPKASSFQGIKRSWKDLFNSTRTDGYRLDR